VERILQIKKLLLRSKRTPWVLVALSLGILAGAILLTMQQTRASIRAQIAGRDGEVLHAVARMTMPSELEGADVVGSMDDPANQLAVLLETSRLSVAMGARLFDTDGGFVGSFPGDMLEAGIGPEDLRLLRDFKPVSHFHPATWLSDFFVPAALKDIDDDRRMPVLEVNVPLHVGKPRRLVGIAQFIIEGHSIAAEFARLDRHLLEQALMAFLAGGIVLVAAIAWSFRRLNHAHRLLAERTENLITANQELALAAKTSAVGAVTSHLIHGLRNPLAGLQNFVAGLGANLADHPDTDLQQAIAATRRMQTMINEVVGVLREEDGAGQYEIPVTELVEMISGKVQPLCRERGVGLVTSLQSQAILPNRAANLVALILVNLVQNAVEATPREKVVRLSLTQDGERLLAEVQDQGRGFPAERSVFAPCQSRKEGGSGIGLAISKQLANHLGAGLELSLNSPNGCVFVLSLPASLWKAKTSSVTVTMS
jgi:signal transduction histidine kinase